MIIDETLNYRVKDITLADWGRKEIEIAEKEKLRPTISACIRMARTKPNITDIK
jgi:S-adenosylhomocysteine hydrolase